MFVAVRFVRVMTLLLDKQGDLGEHTHTHTDTQSRRRWQRQLTEIKTASSGPRLSQSLLKDSGDYTSVLRLRGAVCVPCVSLMGPVAGCVCVCVLDSHIKSLCNLRIHF